MTETSNQIHGLILDVMCECPVVAATKEKGSAINYPYRKVHEIVNQISALCQKFGVIQTVNVTLLSHTHVTTAKGGNSSETILTSTFRWSAPDGSFVESTCIGEARDVSDKSANKAMSAAWKYALLQTFQIATAEIEDADDYRPEPVVEVERAQTKTKASTAKVAAVNIEPVPVAEVEPESSTDLSVEERIAQATSKLKGIFRSLPGQREVLLYMIKQEHEKGDWLFPACKDGGFTHVSPVDLAANLDWTEWMVQMIETAQIQEDGSVA